MRYPIPKNNELLSITGIIVLLLAFFFIGRLIDFEIVNSYIRQAGVWAPILFILAKASTIFFTPISGSPLYILVGSLFGIKEGILYTFLGDLLGFSLVFYFSRKYGLRLIRKVLGDKEKKVMRIVNKNVDSIKSFIKVAALFFWFPEIVIAASGLSKMSYLKVMGVFMPIYSFGASVFIYISTTILRG